MNIQTLTSNIADVARHAYEDMGDKLEHGRETLEETRDAGVASVSSVIDKGSNRVRTLASLVGAYTSLRALSKAFEMAAPGRRTLNMFGLQRRPSTLSRVVAGAGLVAVGAAVGAGVVLFLTPKTGAQMRKEVDRRIRSLKRDAEGLVHDVEEAAQEAAQAVEHSAQEAMSDVSSAVRGVGTQSEPKSEAAHRPRATNPKVSHRKMRA